MRTVVLLSAAIVTTGCLRAQDVLLRLRPPEGQVTTYVLTVEAFLRGGPMAQLAPDSTVPFSRMTAWNTSTVTAAAPDGYTERVVIDSVRMQFPAMPQMTPMAGQMGTLMAGTETRSRVSSRGAILETEFTPSPALRDMMVQMGVAPDAAGQLGMGGADRMTLPSFWLLPDEPVRVGSVWRDSMTVTLDSTGTAGGVMRFVAEFTLRSVDGQVAVVGIDGVLGMSAAELAAAVGFSVVGNVRLDLAAGRPTGFTLEMDGSAPTPMGEMPMRIRTTMTARDAGG